MVCLILVQLMCSMLRMQGICRFIIKNGFAKYPCIVPRVRNFQTSLSFQLDDKPKPPPEFTHWPGKEYSTAWQIKDKGVIYDKKPFKIKCAKGKTYMWCACGLSRTQPLCDGTHKSPFTKTTLKPVKFIAPEDKEYWFCNCKQTNTKPFCDGTHKREDIQLAIKT